jgi:hypothetical protein
MTVEGQVLVPVDGYVFQVNFECACSRVCVCVCECVSVSERKRERDGEIMCAYVIVIVQETVSQLKGILHHVRAMWSAREI